MNYWKRQQLTKMTLLKFSQTLEEKIQEQIEEAYPTDWDEDYITRRILVAIKSLTYSQVEVLTTFNNIFITAFKLKGNLENAFGDIAFVLDIEYKDGEKLKGVAFLEAKKRYLKSNDYYALDFDQLKRIYENAPSSRLLLYNNQYMSSLAPTGLDNTKHAASGVLPKIPATYTSVLPTNTAIHINNKTETLHKYSIPFSYQFVYRYLFGMDLEFKDDIVNKTIGFVSDQELLSKYVVMVAVKPGRKSDKEIDYAYQPSINKEFYAEITDFGKFNKE
jgi:hypothetical protein